MQVQLVRDRKTPTGNVVLAAGTYDVVEVDTIPSGPHAGKTAYIVMAPTYYSAEPMRVSTGPLRRGDKVVA